MHLHFCQLFKLFLIKNLLIFSIVKIFCFYLFPSHKSFKIFLSINNFTHTFFSLFYLEKNDKPKTIALITFVVDCFAADDYYYYATDVDAIANQNLKGQVNNLMVDLILLLKVQVM